MKKVLKILFILGAVNGILWLMIFSIPPPTVESEIYFLDVGQGDSQFLSLAGANPAPVSILIDGGPGRAVVEELARLTKTQKQYIDVLAATHPQDDHIGGLVDVLQAYEVGLLITNGRRSEIASYKRLINLAEERGVPIIVLGAGDVIRYGKNQIDILAPTAALRRDPEINNASLVMYLAAETSAGPLRALFTGDAGFPVENYLINNFDFQTDILKVGHHGSKYASGREFLEAIAPKVAVIEVGKNRYGHPTAETLNRLKQQGASIYDTLNDGTVKIMSRNDQLLIYRREK